MDTPAKSRNLNLDLLKLIACTAVIGLHIHIKHDSTVARTLYYLCTFGVPVFFMTTGYLLLDRQHFSASYIFRKLCSILRVTVLWSIIAALVKMAASLVLAGSLERNPVVEVLRVLYLGLQDQGIMFVMWYLGALFLIYLTLPAVSRLLRGEDGSTSTRRMLLLWGALALLIVASRIVSLLIGRMLQNRVWLTYRIWTYWQFLLLGCLLKRLQPTVEQRLTIRAHLWLTVLLSALAAAEFVCIKRFYIENAWGSTAYDSLAMILWTSSMFTLVCRLKPGTKTKALVSQLAPLTMGVYLVHPIFIEIGDVLLQRLSLSGFAVTECYYLCILLLSFPTAWIIKKLPGGRLLTSL